MGQKANTFGNRDSEQILRPLKERARHLFFQSVYKIIYKRCSFARKKPAKIWHMA
jgi:hypothetical protein